MFMQIENGIEETTELHHLYVHIPFCPKVCPYCSFYKEASDRNKTQAFLDSVLLDLDRRLEKVASCRIETIFFGGGTPSALSVKQLEFLLSGLHRRLDLTGVREWTLEMNPATVSLEKAQMLRDFGVNRISMGVQSWDPEMLNRLGRVHSALQAERSFHILREAGFTNLNLDLIFGIPGQSVETWETKSAKDDRPGSGAYFCLLPDVRGGHRIFSTASTGRTASRHGTRRQILRADDGASRERRVLASTKSPTTRIPVTNALHNLAYWLGRDYLGLGSKRLFNDR